MAKKTKLVEVNPDDMTVTHAIESGKIIVLILDGHQGKAKAYEAMEHGSVLIEIENKKTKRVRFNESELF